MTQTILAVAASSAGVLMGLAPVLQIRRMLRERSSAQVSVGYFLILLAGFLLWIAYGVSLRNPALIVPNSVALLITAMVITVALPAPAPGHPYSVKTGLTPRVDCVRAGRAAGDRCARKCGRLCR